MSDHDVSTKVYELLTKESEFGLSIYDHVFQKCIEFQNVNITILLPLRVIPSVELSLLQ